MWCKRYRIFTIISVIFIVVSSEHCIRVTIVDGRRNCGNSRDTIRRQRKTYGCCLGSSNAYIRKLKHVSKVDALAAVCRQKMIFNVLQECFVIDLDHGSVLIPIGVVVPDCRCYCTFLKYETMITWYIDDTTPIDASAMIDWFCDFSCVLSGSRCAVQLITMYTIDQMLTVNASIQMNFAVRSTPSSCTRSTRCWHPTQVSRFKRTKPHIK